MWQRKCWSSVPKFTSSKLELTLLIYIKVQLLVTSQDVDNYKQIKSDLDQLRSIVEKSELWVYKRQGEDGMDGDGPSESDNKKKVQSATLKTSIIY